ncbi:MAG: VWA domain-containing protein, partial [Pirellulaceae bacterium]
NLQATIALDTSGSMRFGLSTVTKFDYARRAAACLARLLLHQRDAIGAAILHETAPVFVPPRQNASHLQTLLMALAHASPSAGGNLAAHIRACIPRLRRRGLFVLFSDCFADLDELAQAIKVLRARGHDVLVFQVLAPEEITFDFRHWSTFQSLEVTGLRRHLDPAAVRDEYLARMRAFLDRLADAVTGMGADYVRTTTRHDLSETLTYFLRSRMAKGRAAGSVHARMVTM